MTLREVLVRYRDSILAEMARDGFYYCQKRRFDPVVWDINNGYCEEFAYGVLAELPPSDDTFVVWLEDEIEGAPAHYVLAVGGRYYDAEAIDGVDTLTDLPIFEMRMRP